MVTIVNGPVPRISQNQTMQIPSPVGSTVVLTTVSATVLGPNPSRRGVRFFNPSDVVIYVCPDNLAAVIGQGIQILPGGGPVDMIGDGALINYNCGWNGIAASGSNKPLTVLELL